MPQRLEDRAKEPVARCLDRRLILPTIYFDAPRPSQDRKVDLLVLDRAGVGDVHIVEIEENEQLAQASALRLQTTPAHYRWVAYPADEFEQADSRRLSGFLYPFEGMGRIGVIIISRSPSDEITAEVKIPAERFAGSYYRMADEFTAVHEADMEYRS